MLMLKVDCNHLLLFSYKTKSGARHISCFGVG